MRPSLLRSLLLVAIVAISSCGRPLPSFDGLDLTAWKNDRNGCGGQRKAVIDTLRNQRNKLQGLSEMQVVELLGRPDKTELYKRNQKFYYYLLEPSSVCGRDGVSRKLSVRFNAVGLAKEIVME